VNIYTFETLLDGLREAVANSDLAAVADLVRRAIRERPFVSPAGLSQLLHGEPGLTILHAAVNSRFASPPHDHRTWAVIGVYDGEEENTFYRVTNGARRIEPIGSHNLKQGEVLSLGVDAIHKIANRGTSRLVALHVYGRNIFEIERSAWDLATGDERPFRLVLDAGGRVTR